MLPLAMPIANNDINGPILRKERMMNCIQLHGSHVDVQKQTKDNFIFMRILFVSIELALDNETFLTKIVFIRSPDFQFFNIQFTNNRHENKFPDFALSLPFARIGRSDHRSPSRSPNTPLCNRPSGIYILAGFSEKTSPGRQIFHQVAPFYQVPVLPFSNIHK